MYLVGVLTALLITFLAPRPPATWTNKPTEGQIAILITFEVLECLYFGIGVVFLVFIGAALPKLSARVKRWKAIGMYLSVGWILISWFPHVRLHAYFSANIWAFLAIDISFHWTVATASLFLAKFIFTFLKNMSDYSNKNKILSRNFWRTDTFQI